MKLLGQTDGETVIASISHYDCRTHGEMLVDGGQRHTLQGAGYNRFGQGEKIWFEIPETFADLYNDYNFNKPRKYGKWNIKDVRVLPKEEWPDTEDETLIRENCVWGSRGKSGNEPLKYYLVKDLELGHLEAIIAIIETQGLIGDRIKEVIEYWIGEKKK